MIVCRAVGQEITGARLFIQAGKFFERAPDEMPYACYWDRRRRRTTRRSARACACSGACSSPVVVLLPRLLSTCSFFDKCRFYGHFRPSSDQISCSLQGRGEKRSRCKRQLHFRKLESRKRASTCSRSTPKRTRGFVRYGGCKATITQPKSAFCQHEANG
jgi:hypothetical protein